MILDTSAIAAIYFREPEFEQLESKILTSRSIGIGAPTLVEAGLVISSRLGEDARGLLGQFLRQARITTIPFGEAHYDVAVEAWLRYGRGRHSAGLNFGDCLTYATSKIAGEPLLCVGNDFSKTDLELA
jgi:ribonuclease VapC